MLFCPFLCRHCTTTTWKCLISRFMEDVNKRLRIFFLFLNLSTVPKKPTRGHSPAFGIFSNLWINAKKKKIEKTRTHFNSDVFAAFAVVDAKAPLSVYQSKHRPLSSFLCLEGRWSGLFTSLWPVSLPAASVCCSMTRRFISMLSSMLPPASSATSVSLEQELEVWAAMDRDTWGLTADGAGMVTGIVDGPLPCTPENNPNKRERSDEMLLAILWPPVEYNTLMTLQPIKFYIQIWITI